MKMMAIGPDATRRIAAIAALTQSPVDGEALAALRKLQSALAREGLRIGEVVARGLTPPCQSTAPEPVSPVFSHQRDATEAADVPVDDFFTSKEADFIVNMMTAPRCSPAQREWLDRLVAKARAARAAEGV